MSSDRILCMEANDIVLNFVLLIHALPSLSHPNVLYSLRHALTMSVL